MRISDWSSDVCSSDLEARGERYPDAGDGVQIAPECPPATCEAGVEHARKAAPPARPPQIEAGQQHHQRPARRGLDKETAERPRAQSTVAVKDEPERPLPPEIGRAPCRKRVCKAVR